jgi:hypothetical protein
MEAGFEAGTGAAEKVLGVKLPVLMRIVLPGLAVTAVLYPWVAWLLGYLPRDTDHIWEPIAGYAVLVLLLGAVVSTGSSEIYKICEGRTRWPEGLRKWAVKRQQARVDRLMKAAKAAKVKDRYDELWLELRAYPTNGQGDPEATYPTMLGNILAGYEQYPSTRYGMDSVFYWRRIWLQIEKEQKEEIDNQWCVADGFLILSAVCAGGAVVWALQALAAEFGVGVARLPFGLTGLALAGVPGWLALAYLLYRVSLPFHRENGEVFKSIFDIHREKVWAMTSLKPGESQSFEAAWGYLQYLAFQCPNCKKWTSYVKDNCETCGMGLAELKKSLCATGKLPTV